jgi:hypothetical protein
MRAISLLPSKNASASLRITWLAGICFTRSGERDIVEPAAEIVLNKLSISGCGGGFATS